MPPTTTLYILYNATSTLFGKLSYSYRKITCSKSADPACAACDLTHGGLHLQESAAWRGVKAEIMRSGNGGGNGGGEGGMEVKQLHRDELDADIKKFIDSKPGVKYPMVVLLKRDLQEGGGGDKAGEEGKYEVVMDSTELAALGGDAGGFVARLREKGVVGKGRGGGGGEKI